MSWASRRQTTFLGGIFVALVVLIGIPVALFLHKAPTCTDGVQNQGETAPDRGGPCLILDEHLLAPSSVLWARSFALEQGKYSSVAYIENPNKEAGVRRVNYKFELRDSDNVIIATRDGATYIMPGGVTPVFEYNIETGNRIVVHTDFCFADSAGNCDRTGSVLIWERMGKGTAGITINNLQSETTDTTPRISAVAENVSVSDAVSPAFSAAVFDSAGNVFAVSRTIIERLSAGESHQIVFTWSAPFTKQIGRVDILPILPPLLLGAGQ